MRNVQLASVESAYLQVTMVIAAQVQMKQLSDSGPHAMEWKIAQCAIHAPRKTKDATTCIASDVNRTGAGFVTKKQTSFITNSRLRISSQGVLASSSP